MTDRRNLFDQPINNDIKIQENILKIATGHRDDHTTGCLLNYPISKKTIHWLQQTKVHSKHPNANPKAIKQINFTGNLDQGEGAQMVFIFDEVKETILDFSKGAVRLL